MALDAIPRRSVVLGFEILWDSLGIPLHFMGFFRHS